MPYYHQPGQTFTPVLLGAPTGVQAALGLRLIDASTGTAAATIAAGASSGVVEINPPSGNYRRPAVAVPTTAGTYLIQWDHGATEIVDSEQLVVTVGTPPTPQPGITPTLAEVGSLVHARTKDSSGAELGTFTSATRPTGTQVEALVALAVNDLVMRVGGVGALPDTIEPSVRWVVTLRTAMLVEVSYFPEQASQDNSAFDRLREMYEEAVGRLDGMLPGGEVAQGVVSFPLTTVLAEPYVSTLP